MHQGDGTASILSGIDEIFTFSMHCQKNYPFLKQKSDLDVPLNEELMDDQYIEILKKNLSNLESIDSDIIFFKQALIHSKRIDMAS